MNSLPPINRRTVGACLGLLVTGAVFLSGCAFVWGGLMLVDALHLMWSMAPKGKPWHTPAMLFDGPEWKIEVLSQAIPFLVAWMVGWSRSSARADLAAPLAYLCLVVYPRQSSGWCSLPPRHSWDRFAMALPAGRPVRPRRMRPRPRWIDRPPDPYVAADAPGK